MKNGGEMAEIQSPVPRVVKPMARAHDDHDLLVEEVIKCQCPRGLGFGPLVICLEQRRKIGIA